MNSNLLRMSRGFGALRHLELDLGLRRFRYVLFGLFYEIFDKFLYLGKYEVGLYASVIDIPLVLGP